MFVKYKIVFSLNFYLYKESWLATVDDVKTKILLLSEEIIIPELTL